MAVVSEKTLDWVDKYLPGLLLMIALLRIGFLLVNGLDLIGDESYYWDWSRQLDWCYYSKPPMVAWLIALSTAVFGDWTWAVRLPAVLLGTLFLWFFHATTKAFYGRQAAALAVLLILATPINALANFLMTIDPPLYCFWMMTLYFLRRAVFDDQPRAWLWAGLASAAALMSKQVAIALPLSLLIFLLLDAPRRHFLRRQFLIYLLPIMLAAAVLLYWNAQHDWVMFGHSKKHFAGQQAADLLKHIAHTRDFLLYQLLLLSPVLFVLLVIDAVGSLLRFKALSSEQRFLWLMGPLAMLAVLLLSLLQKAQGNWPMAFYFSGTIMLAGKAVAGNWQRSLRYGLWLGYVLVVTTYLLPILIQHSGLQNTAFDPTKRFKHWQELAVDINFERLVALPSVDDTFVVALGHRYLASQLAFYLPDHPKVYRYQESGQIQSQYEVWNGPIEFIGKNAVIVGNDDQNSVPTVLKDAFTGFRFLAQVANPDKPKSPYSLYLGEGLKYWPDPVNRHSTQTTDATSEN